MNKRSNKGFTLIEMLVVIAIIAVLVSIIVPIVSNASDKAAAAADAANLRAAMTEILAQVMDGNIDPGDTWIDAAGENSLSADVQKMESRYTANATLYYQVNTDGSVKVGFSTDGKTVLELEYYQTIAETGNEPTTAPTEG